MIRRPGTGKIRGPAHVLADWVRRSGGAFRKDRPGGRWGTSPHWDSRTMHSENASGFVKPSGVSHLGQAGCCEGDGGSVQVATGRSNKLKVCSSGQQVGWARHPPWSGPGCAGRTTCG